MADLNTDVRYIKGIGEKKAQALNKLGVFSLYDLISYFPRKYEDRSVYKPIALTADGETVCVCALVADTPRLTRIRRGLDIVKLRAVDESGVLDVTFFNQSYAKDNLHRGESYIFYGKIEARGARRARVLPSTPLQEPARGQARCEGEEGSAVQSLTPKTLAELAQALSADTEKAKIIAGGTDFIIKERAGKFAPDLLIYPGFIPELNTVTKENGVLRIGAAVPMNGITAALKDDKAFCAIADAASDVGSPQIRAKGTMAGNLCNASPAGDMLPVSWLYDAQLELMNADGAASVTPVNGFITGPQKTILRPDQAVTAILIGLKQFEGFVSAFHKIGSRERVSISREGLAAAVRLDESGKVEQARLSLGAVGGTPIRVTDAEEYMRGRVLDEKLVEEITPMVAETIHNNCRPANRLYKTEAARGLTADTFAKLMSRL